jgi:cell division protein FtsB
VAGPEHLRQAGAVNRRVIGGLVALLALVVVVLGGNGLVRVYSMKREVEAIEREIGSLREEAQALAKTAETLRSDPAAVERLAREELGYVRPGDRVLKFPPTKKDQQ